MEYATFDARYKHSVRGGTVDQCKVRCADGKTWPGCKGFHYSSSGRACTWASESSQLKPNKKYGSNFTLYTLLTARPVDANGAHHP